MNGISHSERRERGPSFPSYISLTIFIFTWCFTTKGYFQMVCISKHIKRAKCVYFYTIYNSVFKLYFIIYVPRLMYNRFIYRVWFCLMHFLCIYAEMVTSLAIPCLHVPLLGDFERSEFIAFILCFSAYSINNSEKNYIKCIGIS